MSTILLLILSIEDPIALLRTDGVLGRRLMRLRSRHGRLVHRLAAERLVNSITSFKVAMN